MSKRDWYMVGTVLLIVGFVVTYFNPIFGGVTAIVGYILCVKNQ